VIVAATAPMAYASASERVVDGALRFNSSTARFVWPKEGTAAVAIPTLAIAVAGPNQRVVPIASLTKLMTARVVLDALPLAKDATGPCLHVTNSDAADYQYDQRTDQSSIKVAVGTTLCERNLLDGLFVHSASNYADMLTRLVHLNLSSFVAKMNATAVRLNMRHTSYADISGISPHSVSTAADQMRVVESLMAMPVVRDIAAQGSVTLPGAGLVRTFTPLLGANGVVGIKSGYTGAAGGCDAMAVREIVARRAYLAYAVVLSQHHGRALQTAGQAALDLVRSTMAQVVVGSLHNGQTVGVVGWLDSSSAVVVHGSEWFVFWRHPPTLALKWKVHGTSIDEGSEVATIRPFRCSHCATYGHVTLAVRHDISRPPWWNGLR
jgi:D-alanyl-D-alanine carboxypeptidase (penicillin-binding protein 5/6)